jgi:hypothetical protein
MPKKYSRVVRKLTHILAAWDIPTTLYQSVIGPGDEYVREPHGLADIIERALEGETIKKSEYEHLKRVEKGYSSAVGIISGQLDEIQKSKEESDVWHLWFNWSTDKRIEDQIKIHKYKDKLWSAEQEVHDLKSVVEQAADRLTERNETVARLLHNGINLAAELRGQRENANSIILDRESIIDDLIEENLNLHHKLILEKDCNRMAEQVVQLADEIEPRDVLKWADYNVKYTDTWGGKFTEPDPYAKFAAPEYSSELNEIPRPLKKRNYTWIAVGLLIGALIGMTALFVREAQIIQTQRHLILEMFRFIQAGCPVSQLN